MLKLSELSAAVEAMGKAGVSVEAFGAAIVAISKAGIDLADTDEEIAEAVRQRRLSIVRAGRS